MCYEYAAVPFHDRLLDAFDDMVLYKDSNKGNSIAEFKLPSFMRDWVMKRFQDEDGVLDIEEATKFIKDYIPKKEEWKNLQDRIVTKNERVKFLGMVTVKIDIKTQQISFSLPDFGIGYKDTIIPADVWESCSAILLRSEETWGIIELGYLPPDENNKNGKIKMLNFQDFCPYEVDLDEFKEARTLFSLEEWVDILLSAVDYNPLGYDNMTQKLSFLKRLLPFVEKNLNLVELAPPGTGKSYIFGQVSRYGWLVTGKATRPQLIYNRANKRDGVVAYKDFLALDEIREADYMKDTEMHSALQQIMENKKYKSDDGHEVNVDASIVFLGNIEGENMNEYTFMFKELPLPFHKSPFLDRIHGFIRGWEMPRLHVGMHAHGWALNAEYFSTIMHKLRDDPSYRSIVDAMLILPEKSDTRDTEAICKICTAYLKLLFPNVKEASELDPFLFDSYCLRPAMEMRSIIRVQMGLADQHEAGKTVPDIQTKGL